MTSRRITVKDLESIIARINRETGSPAEPWTADATGRLRANIGNFHLSRAYGGFALHRMVTDGGGVSEPLHTGHVPARELLTQLHAYLYGFAAAKGQA
jgi:hypothetical protein